MNDPDQARINAVQELQSEITSLKSQLEQAQGKIEVYEKLIHWLPKLEGYSPEDIGLQNVNLYNRDIVACRAALERSKE